VPLPPHPTFGPTPIATRLDALAALRDTRRVEELSKPARPGTYVEPFALRALRIVRGDNGLPARADERFAALDADRHRAQTEELLRV
jgi:hypothetical protein